MVNSSWTETAANTGWWPYLWVSLSAVTLITGMALEGPQKLYLWSFSKRYELLWSMGLSTQGDFPTLLMQASFLHTYVITWEPNIITSDLSVNGFVVSKRNTRRALLAHFVLWLFLLLSLTVPMFRRALEDFLVGVAGDVLTFSGMNKDICL